MAFLPEIDTGEATVSEEGDGSVCFRVICDRRLDGGRPCALRADHRTPCSTRLEQP